MTNTNRCKDCDKQIGERSTSLRCRSCAAKARWLDPEYRAMISERRSEQMKQQWQDSEYRATQSEQRSEQTKQQWEDSEFRAMMSELMASPEYKMMQSEQMKRRWQNPEFRGIMSERDRQMSKQAEQQWQDPEFRAMMSEMSKQLWQDPEYRTIQSEKTKQQWQNPERKAMMMGENNPNWQGGVSFEPYSPEFNETLKREIRERDNHTCAISGEPGRHVHHINYDKTDNRPENLITLSTNCHTKTNFNREYWECFLSPIAIARSQEMHYEYRTSFASS